MRRAVRTRARRLAEDLAGARLAVARVCAELRRGQRGIAAQACERGRENRRDHQAGAGLYSPALSVHGWFRPTGDIFKRGCMGVHGHRGSDARPVWLTAWRVCRSRPSEAGPMTSRRAIFILWVALSHGLALAEPHPPEDTLRRFYGWVLANPGMSLPSPTERQQLEGMASPRLMGLLAAASARKPGALPVRGRATNRTLSKAPCSSATTRERRKSLTARPRVSPAGFGSASPWSTSTRGIRRRTPIAWSRGATMCMSGKTANGG